MINHKTRIITAIALGYCTISLMTLSLSAGVTKSSGETTTRPIWVECLNDSIIIDYSFDRLVSTVETDNTWNFTRRFKFSGSAVTLSGDNSWSVNGGWTTHETVNYKDTGYISRTHQNSKDILVADQGNTIGNLILSWSTRLVYDYGTGEYLVFEDKETVSCMP